MTAENPDTAPISEGRDNLKLILMSKALFVGIAFLLQLFNYSCKKSEKQVDVSINQVVFSEEESLQIVRSAEFKSLVRIQNEFLDKISLALKKGSTLNHLADLSRKAIQNDKDDRIYNLLFGSRKAGNEYFLKLQAARKQFLSRNPKILSNQLLFACVPCRRTVEEEIAWFYKLFHAINESRLAFTK